MGFNFGVHRFTPTRASSLRMTRGRGPNYRPAIAAISGVILSRRSAAKDPEVASRDGRRRGTPPGHASNAGAPMGFNFGVLRFTPTQPSSLRMTRDPYGVRNNYRLAIAGLFFSRTSTAAQSMLVKKASMYFGRSAGL
jgi:hypothetical protein